MTILKTLPSVATPDDVAVALAEAGAVIVNDRLPAPLLAATLAELGPFIERTTVAPDEFSGTRTTRTGAVVARSAAARRIVMDPLALGAADRWLRPWCERVQLHLTQVIRILPGQGAQPLHRDHFVLGPHVAGLEPQLNCMWALTDFTAENGATRVAPGSHRWPAGREAREEEVVQAVMPAGSVLFFTGHVIHGGGANRSAGERIGLNIDYSLAWLRQEENQYLSCPPAVARSLEPELQALLGYTMGSYALGYFSPPGPTPGLPGTLPPEFALSEAPGA